MMEAKSRLKDLDRIDRNILNELQKDGRISNVELSKRVGLSPTPCLERVRRLERQGDPVRRHLDRSDASAPAGGDPRRARGPGCASRRGADHRRGDRDPRRVDQ